MEYECMLLLGWIAKYCRIEKLYSEFIGTYTKYTRHKLVSAWEWSWKHSVNVLLGTRQHTKISDLLKIAMKVSCTTQYIY